MNLMDEIDKMKGQGYSEANAEARLCQDIILQGVAAGSMSRNVTIKGGVVMRNISQNARRATLDIDLDFIRYSLADEAIQIFVDRINVIPGLQIALKLPIIELKHRDYKGKRIFLEITDEYGNTIESKADIGVHKDLDIEQKEYAFDICFQDDAVSLLMNSPEQIITEKLKSFLRFGTRSTRYKDIFDICYLSDGADMERLNKCIIRYIFEDGSLDVNSKEDVVKRMERITTSQIYLDQVKRSGKNWLDISVDDAMDKVMNFVKSF